MHKTLKEALGGAVLAFILGFMAIWLAPAHAETLAPFPVTPRDTLYHPHWDRAHCGSVCTVTYSPGGVIDEYLAQVKLIKRDHVMLRIDGPCISACTMTADKARPNVCITPRAVMKFHQGISQVTLRSRSGEVSTQEVRFDPSEYYSADINAWVAEHGGYPGKDTSPEEMDAFLVMGFAEAQHFYKVCR